MGRNSGGERKERKHHVVPHVLEGGDREARDPVLAQSRGSTNGLERPADHPRHETPWWLKRPALDPTPHTYTHQLNALRNTL